MIYASQPNFLELKIMQLIYSFIQQIFVHLSYTKILHFVLQEGQK